MRSCHRRSPTTRVGGVTPARRFSERHPRCLPNSTCYRHLIVAYYRAKDGFNKQLFFKRIHARVGSDEISFLRSRDLFDTFVFHRIWVNFHHEAFVCEFRQIIVDRTPLEVRTTELHVSEYDRRWEGETGLCEQREDTPFPVLFPHARFAVRTLYICAESVRLAEYFATMAVNWHSCILARKILSGSGVSGLDMTHSAVMSPRRKRTGDRVQAPAAEWVSPTMHENRSTQIGFGGTA